MECSKESYSGGCSGEVSYHSPRGTTLIPYCEKHRDESLDRARYVREMYGV